MQRIRPIDTFYIAAILTATLCICGQSRGDDSQGDDWPQFRGPQGSGISPQVGLLRSWPEGGPEILWRRPLGEGFSAISVFGDRFFTLYARDSDEYAASFRVADGSEVWRRRIGEKFIDHWGNGPRATPAVDGETIYALSSYGGLFALRAADGEVIWQIDLTQRFGDPNRPVHFDAGAPAGAVPLGPYWGYCSSPLIEGDLLLVYTGAGHGNSLMAFDKRSGEVRWSRFDHLSSNSSPVAMTIGGRRQIVVAMAHEIVSVQPSGEVLWRHPWARYNVSLPAFLPPNKIFFSSPNDVGAALLAVHPDAEGNRVEEIWRNPRMRNNWQTSVGYQGSVVGFDRATLKSLAQSGELQWAKRSLGKGTLVLADDLLFVLSDQGVLTLTEWSTESYRETGRMKVFAGPSYTAPAVAQGRLFLRNTEEMVCLNLKD